MPTLTIRRLILLALGGLACAQGAEKPQRISPQVARAHRLLAQGKTEASVAAFEEAIRAWAKHPSARIRAAGLKALHESVRTLLDGEQYRAALSVTDNARRAFARDPSPDIQAQSRRQVAQVLEEFATLIDRTSEGAEPHPAYEALVGRFEDSLDPDIAVWVLPTRINRAVALSQAGRRAEAIALLRAVRTQFGPSREPELHTMVNHGLANLAQELGHEEAPDEVLALCGEIASRNALAHQPDLDDPSIRAMNLKGLILLNRNAAAEALPCFEQALSGLQQADKPAEPLRVTSLQINKALALEKLERLDEAVASLDDVIRWTPEEAIGVAREYRCLAMVNKGFCVKDPAQAQRDFDEAIRSYEAVQEEEIQAQVARAHRGKVYRHFHAQPPAAAEAEAALGLMATRFGKAEAPGIQNALFLAFQDKADALSTAQRHAEALATLETALQAHGKQLPRADRLNALNSLGFWRILLAKQRWAEGGRGPIVEADLKTAIALLQQAEGEATEAPLKAMLLGNLGYAHHLLDQSGPSEAALREALRLGGEPLVRGELEDADRHPCPKDPAFKALVTHLWKDQTRGNGPRS